MQKNVIEYLSDTVIRFPDKIAVKDSNSAITFKELWNNAKKISSYLNTLNIGKNKPVCVYIPKGCKMIESFAGINMCSNFYVPLDTKSPLSRIKSIISVLESKFIITDRENKESLGVIPDVQILIIEDIIKSDISIENSLINIRNQIDTDPVYCIFTSGSTGTPKGVVVSHRGVIDYIDWANDTFKFDKDMVIGNQAPFYFDNSTLDIYLMYSMGATLKVIPESCFSFPAKLMTYLNEEKISFVFWVPFVLVNVANLNILESIKPQFLKDIFFAGEVMPTKHLNYWRRHMPDCRYVNLYGPTEITVDCTYYEVTRDFTDNEPLPIGIPCRNSDVMILVDRNRPAKRGEQGELCVRGSSLALGYYNNPEKTKSSFIQNPIQNHYPEIVYCTGDVVYENEFGEYIYIGRIDSQIKHNGYRIELGEIESAVIASNLVENCCVVYDFSNKRIVMFYQAPEELNMPNFRKDISAKIPRYMIPSQYHREDLLRQNGSGKIDRAYYNKQVNKKN